ncbi:retropepsin-like aspartic protease [Pseudomonas vancouverensis]|uniref:retropepsin-like aspartic protease n=1 Tax=Pseudomonas vancouverensis TaxID=95300 RepID=UPI003D06C89A
MKPLNRWLLPLLLISTRSPADSTPDQDFYAWLATVQGQTASLAQLRQQCDKVLDALKNLSCSVTVFARMLEAKAANQLPEYYLAIQRRHGRAIETDADLKPLFSMFGDQSLTILAATGEFSISGRKQPEVLPIHPYAKDAYITEEVLPFVDVDAANGATARFVLDTGAPQTRVNTATAKLMGIRLLPDASYRYSTFYGEKALPARLGILASLRVGHREFRNVLVFVSDRENLLGLDLISKLGPLRITKRTLEFNPSLTARCDTPITYSRQDLNQRLLVAAWLDHRATRAIIDTGNVDYLTTVSLGDQVGARAMWPGNSPAQDPDRARYQSFQGVLAMQGNALPVTYKYFPGFTLPPSWVAGRYVPSILLGWHAFNDFELRLDIESGHSCLNRI